MNKSISFFRINLMKGQNLYKIRHKILIQRLKAKQGYLKPKKQMMRGIFKYNPK